jgi:hypothetical protein
MGLGHAGVGDNPYADMTDVMGYVSSSKRSCLTEMQRFLPLHTVSNLNQGDKEQSGVARCFNGYHFWYLNWFASRSASVDPFTKNLITLAAFADYDKTSADQKVIIKVDTYYLVYNKAKGINSGVFDVPNKVCTWSSESILPQIESNVGSRQLSEYRSRSCNPNQMYIHFE